MGHSGAGVLCRVLRIPNYTAGKLFFAGIPNYTAGCDDLIHLLVWQRACGVAGAPTCSGYRYTCPLSSTNATRGSLRRRAAAEALSRSCIPASRGDVISEALSWVHVPLTAARREVHASWVLLTTYAGMGLLGWPLHVAGAAGYLVWIPHHVCNPCHGVLLHQSWMYFSFKIG